MPPSQRAVVVAARTPFQLYEHERAPQQRILVAETERMVHVAQNFGDGGVGPMPMRYAVALYRPSDSSLTVADAPVFGLTSHVRLLLNAPAGPVAENKIGRRTMAARNLLGETFGTRKLEQQIRSMERNQVDVRSLDPLAGLIGDRLDAKAAQLTPTDEDPYAAEDAYLERAIPPFNVAAQEPSEVYAFSDLLTPAEQEALNPMLLVPDSEETLDEWKRTRRYPAYVLAHLRACLSQAKRSKAQLRRLLYAHYLLRFVRASESHLNDAEKFAQLLDDAPEAVQTRLRNDFAESYEQPGTDVVRFRLTPKGKDRVISYLLALCLFIEGDFALEPSLIATDLKETKTKLFERLKNLGCVVEYAAVTTMSQRPGSALAATADDGQSPAAAGRPKTTKVARMRVPLTFPKPKRGPAK